MGFIPARYREKREGGVAPLVNKGGGEGGGKGGLLPPLGEEKGEEKALP